MTVLYTFQFFAGIVAMALMICSVIALRWRTAFFALALIWAMTSSRSRLDELALAVLVCCLTTHEIIVGFRNAKAEPKSD